MDLATLKPHTKVRLTTKYTSYEGLLLPNEGGIIVLKLANGYNIGLSPHHITGAEELSPIIPQKKGKTLLIKQDAHLPKVMILHTGGTIASKVDYATGGVIAKFDPEELISLFPELGEVAYLESELMGNMQSDDFRFSHFNSIASKILLYTKKGIKKFIVTSGTDFLHYLSAALAFILKDVPAGVIVVGAQRSSDRGSSDAGMNLACAAAFLANQEFKGVGVCMHASINDDTCIIIPGVAVRKMHSSRRDAFKPINTSALATIDYASRKITLHQELPVIKDQKLPKELSLIKENLKIGLLYAHPNMFPEELVAYEKFDGIILAGSGLGHFPITKVDNSCAPHQEIFASLTRLAEKMPVVMSVQTISGRVHMNVYSPARRLQEAGVIGHGSLMTTETSFIKLAWLLSNYSKEEAKVLFLNDVVGELRGNESNWYN